MDYSSVFVCLMGMGIVFFGLACLIALTTVMGRIVGSMKSAAPAVPAVSAPAAQPDLNRPEMVAAISAAIAENLGTDITGIRITSIKKL